MKKKFLLAGVSALLCMLCGCLETTPLTDREMDVVAEYAASLLLKYDSDYDSPLYYEDLFEEEAVIPTVTAVPEITVTPILSPEEEPIKSPSKAPEITKAPTPTPLPYSDTETTAQLTRIIDVEHITVSCESWNKLDSVVSNDYFSLQAKEGRKYVAVYFLLTNASNQEEVFDASGKGLSYSLDINTNIKSRVSLSMLENDLQYMPISVPANGTAEAVLVFEIEDIQIDTLHLIISDKEENVVFVKLQ